MTSMCASTRVALALFWSLRRGRNLLWICLPGTTATGHPVVVQADRAGFATRLTPW